MSEQVEFDFGPVDPLTAALRERDRRALYRKGDPDTSRDAALRVDVTALEAMVLKAIRAHGRAGVTGKELAEQFSEYPYSSITARPKALKDKGLVVSTGERRDGAYVLVTVEFVEESR
jgi:DNA-binding MarR family transcriptional regulator